MAWLPLQKLVIWFRENDVINERSLNTTSSSSFRTFLTFNFKKKIAREKESARLTLKTFYSLFTKRFNFLG